MLRRPWHIVFLLPCLLAMDECAGCDDTASVDLINRSSDAIHMMGPEEVQSDGTLLQPDQTRRIEIDLVRGGTVSFRATSDQGLFALATWKISNVTLEGLDEPHGTVIFRDGSLGCFGFLFDDC